MRPEDLVGRHIWTVFPEGIGQPFHLAYEKVMTEQVSIQMETYRLGVNSYIVKPVDFLTFAEVAKTIKMYWLLTNEPPFRRGLAE